MKNQISILEIPPPSFKKEVLQSEVPVLAFFLSGWSEPSRLLAEGLAEFAERLPAPLKIVKVNVDRNPDLGMVYAIHSVPMLLFFSQGKETSRIVGTDNMKATLAKLSNSTNPTPIHK
ncbi:MAG TPA: thioredoxin domain-containing protein [Candidatus Methylacidiphilales bacterium]|nr:thioredoxin domain-containing protein [Candidatus Methylacidiphilales bacterium]